MASEATVNPYCPCMYWAAPLDVTRRHGHHPNCDGTGRHENGAFKESELAVEAPSLSLLVIDLGDCCVVKAEKGSVRVGRYDSLEDEITKGLAMVEGDVQVTQMPFGDLRAALDGEKPVPRIEWWDDAKYYRLFYDDAQSMPIPPPEYDALSQLCGKPLPIWEGNGTWEQLLPSIWRYTR